MLPSRSTCRTSGKRRCSMSTCVAVVNSIMLHTPQHYLHACKALGVPSPCTELLGVAVSLCGCKHLALAGRRELGSWPSRLAGFL